jgi:hypothetical protein
MHMRMESIPMKTDLSNSIHLAELVGVVIKGLVYTVDVLQHRANHCSPDIVVFLIWQCKDCIDTQDVLTEILVPMSEDEIRLVETEGNVQHLRVVAMGFGL